MLQARNSLGVVFFPAFDWGISATHPEREERLLYTQDQFKEEGLFDIAGIDEYRPLDERVEKFCSRFTKKLTVIDIADYELEGIDDEFKVICSPMILTSLVTERLAAHYELTTGHSLQFRRYYRQFEY